MLVSHAKAGGQQKHPGQQWGTHRQASEKLQLEMQPRCWPCERAGQGHQGLAGSWAGCHMSRAPWGWGGWGWGVLDPLAPTAHSSPWSQRFWLLHGPQRRSWPFISAPQAVLHVLLNRPFPGPLHGSSLLLFKKKKRGGKKFFFLPLQKAQGLGERGRADAEMAALGSGLSPTPTPWTPGFHSRSPMGSQRLPLLNDSVKGMLGLALVCHLCPHNREDLGPERVKDLPRVTAEKTQHGNVQGVRGVGGIMLG